MNLPILSLRGQKLVIAGLLASVVVAVYGQTYRFEFVNFDDNEYVYENRQVKAGLSVDGVRWAFTTRRASNWHPLTWISLMTDASIWGGKAGGFHATNVVLHAVNVVLLFLLLTEATASIGPSAVVAVFFAVHPQHAESVAWVTERKDVLSTFFGLSAIWCYIRYAHTGRYQTFAWVVAWYTLSLLSKQMFVTLPLLLLLLDYWPLQRPWSTWRRLLVEKGILAILAFAFALLIFIVQREGGAVSKLEGLPLSLRAMNAATATAQYVQQSFWPTGLAFYYPHPVNRVSVGETSLYAGLLILATAAAFGIRRIAPAIFVGWFWFLIALAPVVGLVQIGTQARADRYMYVPHIGLFIAVVWGCLALVPTGTARKISFAVAMVAAATLAFLCSTQAATWRDSETLARQALAVTRDNSMAHQLLGEILLERNQPADALEHFRTAVQLTPLQESAQCNLALALSKTGAKEEALQHFQTAMKLNPRSIRVLNNFGDALMVDGEIARALEYFRKAVELYPDSVQARNNCGYALARLGDPRAAEREYRSAIAIDPTNAVVRRNLGTLLSEQDRLDEALDQFKAAAQSDPKDVVSRRNQGSILARRGRVSDSIEAFQKALEINPNDSASHALLGRAFAGLGRTDSAIGAFRAALAADPDRVDAANDLAWLRATHSDPTFRDGAEALRLAKKAAEQTKWADWAVLDTLAAAQAETGLFDEADKTAQKAARLAREQGNADAGRQIDERVRLYQSHKPFHES